MESHDVLSSQEHDKNDCLYQGRVYPESSQICGLGICTVCENGNWVETGRGLAYLMF
jgi:hypothetical protein